MASLLYFIWVFQIVSIAMAANAKWLPLPTSPPDAEKGIDVSHYQGDVEWEKVKAAGITFAAAKATEGNHNQDDKFLRNWRGMKQNNIKAAAYHYFRGGQTADSQAVNIRNTLQQAGFTADDILVIDVEQVSNESVSPDNMADTLNGLLGELKKTYRNIYIYCGPYYWEDSVAWNKYDFSQFKLWIAHYTQKSSPKIPSTWKNQGYTWWQYTDRGSVDGVYGNVDMNRAK